MILQIVLMRHATRSAVANFHSFTAPNSSPDVAGSESPLNAQGLAQAAELARRVQARQLPMPTRIYTSPKLRARQTVEPLAASTQLEAMVYDELDERRDHETMGQFEARIKHIAESIQYERGVIYLCTHLDVLEAAAQLWPTDFTETHQTKVWGTLEYQVFNVLDGVFSATQRGRVETV